MRKDKEWLKKEVRNAFSWGVNLEEGGMIRAVDMDYVIKLIDQLEEPEVLSEEWIDEHAQGGCDELVYIEDLENLLVPKQDKQGVEENFYTFDNAKKWLHDNGFIVFEKDKLDEEVQRMVDETYEATKEKPVIPQFVADYYNDFKKYELTFAEWFEFPEFGQEGKIADKTFEWLLDNSHEVNIERQYILADIIAHGLDGYEVEKEKKYRVTFNLTEWNDEASELEEYSVFLALDVTSDETLFTASRDGIRDYRTDLTEFEIKAIDERYWAFAEELEG